MAGYEAHALSFRGHGRSEGRARLAFTGLGDYVEDLETTLKRLAPRPLVVVGYSLGGAVLQAALRHLAGAVLLASVPPYGLAGAGLRLLFRDAAAWSQLMAATQRRPTPTRRCWPGCCSRRRRRPRRGPPSSPRSSRNRRWSACSCRAGRPSRPPPGGGRAAAAAGAGRRRRSPGAAGGGARDGRLLSGRGPDLSGPAAPDDAPGAKEPAIGPVGVDGPQRHLVCRDEAVEALT